MDTNPTTDVLDEQYAIDFFDSIDAPATLSESLVSVNNYSTSNLDLNEDGIISEDELNADLNNDGIISNQESRQWYENGGWKSPYKGQQYYLHPWFNWNKKERWINDRKAIEYWINFQGGNRSALEQYKKQAKYPDDFSSKVY